MAPWLPGIITSILVLLVTVSVQFYFKWVPDVETQKGHFKSLWHGIAVVLRFGMYTVNIALLSWGLYRDVQNATPVTGGRVLAICAQTILLLFFVGVFVLWEGTRLVAFRTHGLRMDPIMGLMNILNGMVEALEILANEESLAPESKAKLRVILYGGVRNGVLPRPTPERDL